MSIFPILRSFAFSVVLMPVLLIAFSCNPDSMKDDADAFVGTYKASAIEYFRWGADSGTLTPMGTIYISKVSSNRIKVSGYLDTYGEVSGKTVYFESTYNSDSAGYLTTVFQQGILSGNVLTFSTTSTGQLKNYPYSATASWAAIRE